MVNTLSQDCHALIELNMKKAAKIRANKGKDDRIASILAWCITLTSKGSLVQSQSCPPLQTLQIQSLITPHKINGFLQVIFCHTSVTHPIFSTPDKSHKNICLFSGVFTDKSGVYPLLISHFHGAKAAIYGLLTSITYIFIREQ